MNILEDQPEPTEGPIRNPEDPCIFRETAELFKKKVENSGDLFRESGNLNPSDFLSFTPWPKPVIKFSGLRFEH